MNGFEKGNKAAVGNPANATSFRKGLVPWNKGKGGYRLWPGGRQMSESHRAALKDAGMRRRGRSVRHNRQFPSGHVPWNKGQPMVHRGSFPGGAEHPKWKGGITPAIQSRVHSRRWRNLRRSIVARDEAKCQWCGTREGQLTVHHIDHDPWNHGHHNLLTLCRSCHAAVTNTDRDDTRIGMAALLWMGEQRRPDVEVYDCHFV